MPSERLAADWEGRPRVPNLTPVSNYVAVGEGARNVTHAFNFQRTAPSARFTITTSQTQSIQNRLTSNLRKQFSHEVAACCSHAASAHGLWATAIHKPRMGRQEERFLVPAHPSARVSEDSVRRIHEPQQQTSIGGCSVVDLVEARVDLLDRKCVWTN